MYLKNFCKFTVIGGAIIIEFIKWVVRPYFHLVQPVKFIMGIMPNLFGAFLLPLGCYWLLNRYINLFSDIQLKLFCFICFLLLVFNEVLQLIPFFGRTFDWNDILASAAGLLLSYAFCSRFLFKRYATYP